jgi:hypothetical protein
MGKEQVEASDVITVARLVLLHRLSSAPLDAPEELLQRIDAVAQRLASPDVTAPTAIPIDEDFDELTDRMQVPGASAAGSVHFEVEKKSP